MSARNGDKSRHAITRKRVRQQRVKIRALVNAARTQPAAEAKEKK
jgi:hypothetical protein